MVFNSRSRSGASWLSAAAVGLALAVGAAVPSRVAGQTPQVQSVDPYCVAVTSDNVPLKGGAGAFHYAIATLKAGQVMRVDGQAAGGWLRVECPKGTKAFLKAEDVAAESDGKEIKLTKPANLMAVNISGGERSHWWYLVEEQKPAGTKFAVLEALKSPDNRVYGYLVSAPPEARGYLKAESTRRATAEETAGYGRVAGVTPAPTSNPATAPKTPVPAAPVPENKPGGEPQPADVFKTPTPGGETPAPGGTPTPAGGTPTSPEAAPPSPETIKPPERKTGTVEALQSLYEEAQRGKETELSSVIAEFERSIRALDSSAEGRRQSGFLKARLEVLKLRQEVIASKDSIGEAGRSVDEQQSKLTEQVKALEKARNYAMVGRLVPSTVYDGKRLPKMYRVQALEPGFARTVGYLFPGAQTEEGSLDSRLGKVVGVVGEMRFDESLRLNIVTPKRVDTLSVAEVPAVAGREPKAPAKPLAEGEASPGEK